MTGNEEHIYLEDASGDRRIFSAAELSSQLKCCFSAAGMDEAAYFADDIALALEYMLYHAENAEDGELVYPVNTVNEQVISLLEDLNMAPVGRVFKSRNGIRSIHLTPDIEMVKGVLSPSFAGISEERFELVAQRVLSGFGKLGLAMATPRLLLELAKSFDSELPVNAKPSPVGKESSSETEYLAEAPDIVSACDGSVLALYEKKVFGIGNISRMIPAFKAYIYMKNFAVNAKIGKPALELELYNQLSSLAAALAAAADAAKRLSGREELPLLIYFADLYAFTHEYFGEMPRKCGGHAAEICREISSMLPPDCKIIIK